jgi:hypothetical protein
MRHKERALAAALCLKRRGQVLARHPLAHVILIALCSPLQIRFHLLRHSKVVFCFGIG